jgi:hypothetical protein
MHKTSCLSHFTRRLSRRVLLGPTGYQSMGFVCPIRQPPSLRTGTTSLL